MLPTVIPGAKIPTVRFLMSEMIPTIIIPFAFSALFICYRSRHHGETAMTIRYLIKLTNNQQIVKIKKIITYNNNKELNFGKFTVLVGPNNSFISICANSINHN